MWLNKVSIIFILSAFAIVSADILQIFVPTTTTRKPTLFVKCFTSYQNLTTNYTELGKCFTVIFINNSTHFVKS